MESSKIKVTKKEVQAQEVGGKGLAINKMKPKRLQVWKGKNGER